MMEGGKELKRGDARPNNRTWDSRGQTGAVICTRKSGQGQEKNNEWKKKYYYYSFPYSITQT